MTTTHHSGRAGAVADPRSPLDPDHHRQVLQALSGLLLGLFVTMLSGTVVVTSLPVIVADIGGGQTAFTWVMTATLLATTVSTPIWGKLADLFPRKLLVQLALVVFVAGSAAAGLAHTSAMLIAFRAVQGVGAGGMIALATIVMADLISPRERGRYVGYLGAVMGVSMVAGPLIGGLITDGIGWRWNFFIGVPIAALAVVVLQKTLHLPRSHRTVRIDYLGALLIATGVSGVLVWVSLAGSSFAWVSGASAALLFGSLTLVGLAIWVESRVAEPIIPLRLFRNRTAVLSVIGSVVVGVGMFGSSVFLGEYLQLSRGQTPTGAGLLTIPQVLGMITASTVIGQVISRTGRYKRWMVAGAVLMSAGFVLLSTMDAHTPFVVMGGYLLVLGVGTGMIMQNLVLVVQNEVPVGDIGVASATVAFFRTMGGAVGVAVLGAVLGSKVTTLTAQGVATEHVPPAQLTALAGGLPEPAAVRAFPEPLRSVVQDAFAGGVGVVFLISGIAAVVAVLAVALLRERPLGTATAIELARESAAEEVLDAAELVAGGVGEPLWVEDAAAARPAGQPAEPPSRRPIRAAAC